jgi:hypothetical protein|nr:hypothetical protein [Candidatus Krumholzibacteria bacterium]
MSHKFVSALMIMAFIAVCTPSWAQDTEAEPSFRLLRDSATAAAELELEEEAAARWVPAIHKGTMEFSFFLGFINLKTTLLAHDQIIYKYTEESTYWGDVAIEGANSFKPGIRLGYNFTKWFALEGIGTVSFAEYTTTVENRVQRPNEAGSPVLPFEPVLGEFDAEARSLITGSVGLNALVYPFNIKGDAQGRLHPFLTAGFSKMWYDMNSNYTDGAAGTSDVNIGGGIRLLADENISIRLEALFHSHTVEFTPAEYFRKLDEGTTLIPLNEYPIVGESFDERRVESFESQSVSAISFSLGVQGSF